MRELIDADALYDTCTDKVSDTLHNDLLRSLYLPHKVRLQGVINIGIAEHKDYR